MTKDIQEAKDVKGLKPRSVIYANRIDEDFGEALAGYYKSVWKERENGLTMKQKHILVFAIACSKLNIESALKILERLKKFEATSEEIKDAMMIAAWTDGIQNFTDFSPKILKEMERLGF
ncbi:MAG: carboxymuconolactone decarboxylase family protein [Methanomethylovorans sp.]|uniref:carboxymuconolactone decarboxylase family protein n=1 Tax=Methanomethylovorans sp. TaxID=2758717 RepID=UPI001BD29FED|nr:carboxymuconolactone decarboxylase family protein [Methanomethylovorans sp.]